MSQSCISNHDCILFLDAAWVHNIVIKYLTATLITITQVNSVQDRSSIYKKSSNYYEGYLAGDCFIAEINDESFP